MPESVLMIGDPLQNLHKAGCVNDYLRDAAFYGLHEHLGDHLRSSTIFWPLYAPFRSQIRKEHLWGRGFSTCWLFDDVPPEEEDVAGKIADRHYDFIIYGNIWICSDHYDLVKHAYPPSRVCMLDGMDHAQLHVTHQSHLYFKRELRTESPPPANVQPISFAMPTPKIPAASMPIAKSQPFATCFPGNQRTYVFETEEEYYADYRRSLFAFTMKKHGWDCMRHYEILANRCIPLFYDIQACPAWTMTTFPKHLCLEAHRLFTACDEASYLQLERRFHEHFVTHNTSWALGRSLLEACRHRALN